MTTIVPVRSAADASRAPPTAPPPAELRWRRRPRAVALIAVAGATSQPRDLDLRARVPGLEVPVYVVAGEHEVRGRVIPAREQPDAFAEVMRAVLSETTR